MRVWKQLLISLGVIAAGVLLWGRFVPGANGMLEAAGLPDTVVAAIAPASEDKADGGSQANGQGGGRRGGFGGGPTLVATKPVAMAVVNDRLNAIGDGEAIRTVTVTPYATGNLTEVVYDPAYFERLRSRVRSAGQRRMYVSVMLFEGWGLFHANRGRATPAGWAWRGHPFHRDNNVNGVNGDADGDPLTGEVHTLANPAVNDLQAAYIRAVVDAVNDLDNVLYEVKSSSSRDSIRFAIGQLFDYRRHLRPEPARLAILLPEAPEKDLRELIESVGISLVYEEGDTFVGRPAGELSLSAVRERLRTDAPGTVLRLTVQSAGGAGRAVSLTLRDLV